MDSIHVGISIWRLIPAIDGPRPPVEVMSERVLFILSPAVDCCTGGQLQRQLDELVTEDQPGQSRVQQGLVGRPPAHLDTEHGRVREAEVKVRQAWINCHTITWNTDRNLKPVQKRAIKLFLFPTKNTLVYHL